MNCEPVEDSRLRRFGLTRSVQDRIFVFLVGILQVTFAIVFLAPFAYKESATDTAKDASLEIALAIWFEFLIALLLLGACCVIWGVAAPKWLEKLFSKALGHFWIVIGVICLLLLLAFGYVILVLRPWIGN